MSNKYFPIKTATACQLKWNWSTVRFYNASTSSCHRVKSDTITVDNFDNFHNTPKKLADRELMLQGQWPTGGCEYCQKIEASGGSSDRMFHSAIPNMSPPELDVDPTATRVTPTILEVYFDNVCNMSCIYCWDGFSSQIQQENTRHGRFEQAGVVIDNQSSKTNMVQELNDKFLSWMEKHSQELRRLHVLGGEPFYQQQFDKCLDFLSTHYNPELEFNVVSNLKIAPARLRKYIEQIHELVKQGRISRFDLTASIDCFGPEQEYVRYGLDLDQWRENFEYLVAQEWITLNINQTLTVLTIKTVPDLLQYINQFRAKREIGHYFGTIVMQHLYLHPEIMGPHYFDQDFEHIFENMPVDTWQQQEAVKYMKGIQSQLNSSSRNPVAINQLSVYLTELDRRRGNSWQTTFPWLVKELENVV